MASEVDLILQRAQKLSADETWVLIRKLAANLRVQSSPESIQPEKPEKREGIYFGKYADYPGPETTEDDFKAVEYHFNEDEWR